MPRPGPRDDFRASKRARQVVRLIEVALWLMAVVAFTVAMQVRQEMRQARRHDVDNAWFASHEKAALKGVSVGDSTLRFSFDRARDRSRDVPAATARASSSHQESFWAHANRLKPVKGASSASSAQASDVLRSAAAFSAD